MKEYQVMLNSFEEAARFVEFIERHDLHGTLANQHSEISCRSFMGILSNSLLKQPLTLMLQEDTFLPAYITSSISHNIRSAAR